MEIVYYEKVLPTPRYIRRKAKADGIAFERSKSDLPSVRALSLDELGNEELRHQRLQQIEARKAKEEELSITREKNRSRSARKLKFSNIAKRRSQNETF